MKDLEEYRNSSYHPAKSGLGRSPDYLMWSPSTWEMALRGIIQLKGDTKASEVMAAGSKDLDSLEKQCSPPTPSQRNGNKWDRVTLAEEMGQGYTMTLSYDGLTADALLWKPTHTHPPLRSHFHHPKRTLECRRRVAKMAAASLCQYPRACGGPARAKV